MRKYDQWKQELRRELEKLRKIKGKVEYKGNPYESEYPLQLNRKRTIYPDFTLLKIDTREEVYLEHLGMMDRPEYAEKNVRKLQEYAQNQIYPGKQLLVTFENSTTPPDMDLTEQMLKEFINNLLLR